MGFRVILRNIANGIVWNMQKPARVKCSTNSKLSTNWLPTGPCLESRQLDAKELPADDWKGGTKDLAMLQKIMSDFWAKNESAEWDQTGRFKSKICFLCCSKNFLSPLGSCRMSCWFLQLHATCSSIFEVVLEFSVLPFQVFAILKRKKGVQETKEFCSAAISIPMIERMEEWYDSRWPSHALQLELPVLGWVVG